MGRINVEIPEELHREAKVCAAEKGITLIQFIQQAIETQIKKK